LCKRGSKDEEGWTPGGATVEH
jgi:hypothetical protein